MRTFHSEILLHEGAIVVADAHYSRRHRELHSFLNAIKDEKIVTTQLILLGDIFDLLFGKVPITIRKNAPVIDTINTLSKKIEIIYFEGNHDFLLQNIFPSVNVIPQERQPQVLRYQNQHVAFSHGDLHMPFGYRLYSALIRNPFILSAVSGINSITDYAITRMLAEKGRRKDLCYRIRDFDVTIQTRLAKMQNVDVAVEGHFHQNVSFLLPNGIRYYNLASFACDRFFYRVACNEGGEFRLIQEEFS